MTIWIGTDEAGYGPNLGPLIIAATVWETDELAVSAEGPDWYRLLASCLTRDLTRDERLVIADSKRLYTPDKGLALLERGLLSALHTAGLPTATWSQLWDSLAPGIAAELRTMPWHDQFELELPTAAAIDRVLLGAKNLTAGLRAAGVKLVAVEATALFPRRFNERVAATGSKGAVLSEETLVLIRRLVTRCKTGPYWIQCDKHGGRNRYAALLQQTFPDAWIEILEEGRQQSRYAWGVERDRIEIRFTVGGESFLPAALASMTAKYLRELAMLPFNQFWQRRIPGLRPTAGYPVDAKRFQSEIAREQTALGIPADQLWRHC